VDDSWEEQEGCHVFRYDPETDELSIATDELIHPNGLAFSPDERRFLVCPKVHSWYPRREVLATRWTGLDTVLPES